MDPHDRRRIFRPRAGGGRPGQHRQVPDRRRGPLSRRGQEVGDARLIPRSDQRARSSSSSSLRRTLTT
ncbi:MAG: hypothetical protein MZV64_11300 [Ignavibacteriales bacterium]|nr:hypothetical protein [Ignavibacteriales bacterium]